MFVIRHRKRLAVREKLNNHEQARFDLLDDTLSFIEKLNLKSFAIALLTILVLCLIVISWKELGLGFHFLYILGLASGCLFKVLIERRVQRAVLDLRIWYKDENFKKLFDKLDNDKTFLKYKDRITA